MSEETVSEETASTIAPPAATPDADVHSVPAVTGRGFGFTTLSTSGLVEFTRSIRFFCVGCVWFLVAMKTLGERGSMGVRSTALAIASELAAGWSFQDALLKQHHRFPQLFVALATVGEETGNLPEVMKDLENYYMMQQKLQRQFIGQIAVPVLQFFAAILIVSLMIWVLGEIKPPTIASNAPVLKPGESIQDLNSEELERRIADKYDPVGLGLSGRDGAILFLIYVFGAIAIIIVSQWVIRKLILSEYVTDFMLLHIPLVAPCVRSLAMTRFSFAMQLMLDTNMSILKTIRLALASTDNAVYARNADFAETMLRRGNTLLNTLTATGLYQPMFLSAVAIGEESGHLPEVMRQQAEQYEEATRRSLTMLTRVMAVFVWLGMAAFVISVIVQLFSGYMAFYEKAGKV